MKQQSFIINMTNQIENSEDSNDLPFLHKLILAQNCPRCQKPKAIRISKIRFVIGVILISDRQTYFRVGCRKCTNIELLKGNMLSLLFGWWSIPFGIIHTIESIFRNTNRIIFFEELSTDSLKFLSKYKVIIEEKIEIGENALIKFLKKPEKENSN